jgi:hypothetical protein
VKLSTGDGVEGPERLVEKDDARPRGDAPSECDALTLPAGELMREPGSEVISRQSHQRQRLPCGVERIFHPLQNGNERDVSQNSPVREKPAVLLYVTYSAPELDGLLRTDISVADFYLAAVRLDQPVEAAEKRRLARSALAHQRNGSPGGNIEAHVIERDDISKAVRDIPRCQRDRHGLNSDSGTARPLSPPRSRPPEFVRACILVISEYLLK